MKTRRKLFLIAAWALSLAAVYWLGRTLPKSTADELRRELHEWKAIMAAPERASGREAATFNGKGDCGDSTCGYHRMLAIWAAMDATAQHWGEPSFIEQLNDPGKVRYPELLPVLNGALHGTRLSFRSYVDLRNGVAGQLVTHTGDTNVARFLASTGSPFGAAPRAGALGPAQLSVMGLTNEACRLELLRYVQMNRHISDAEEKWIVLLGPVYSRSPQDEQRARQGEEKFNRE